MSSVPSSPSPTSTRETISVSGSSSLSPSTTNGGPDSLCGVSNQREPDSDAIKMFVGQIPRDWAESECRNLFSQFGEIYSLNVLRDKATGLSRGCCFVTFYTRRAALDAQNALHNIRTIDGMHHPIQMKPADSENRNERKLFIGMLAKKFNEEDVRLMFAAYGNIEDCTVLRDANGQSKGCAFVTFATRQCAVNAIKAMNHSTTLEGCSSPLVVKFADTQKDKDARRQQQILMQQLAAATVQPNPATATLANPYLALVSAAAAATAQQQQQQQQQLAQQQHLAAATLALQQQLASSTDPLTLAAAAALASNPIVLANLCGANASHAGSTGASTPSTASHMNGVSDLYGPSNPANGHHQPHNNPFSGFQTLSNQAATLAQLAAVTGPAQQSHPGATNSPLSAAATNGSNGKQMEGPDGANLFIYHLPSEFTDTDLGQAFSPFGHVLSSKVFIDKQTNLSKCFGFVSYDNPLSAQAAISSMNGFQIGTKRLKVQLKRSKDKPY